MKERQIIHNFKDKNITTNKGGSMNELKNKQEKAKIESLRWVNQEDNVSFHAGVAFFSPKLGEYKLNIDAPRMTLFLKPVNSTDDEIRYHIFSPIYSGRKLVKKVKIGSGYSNSKTFGEIYMRIGAYYPNSLVLIPSQDQTENK